ncbi:hypothetical protein ACIBTV_28400 [Micromonospora sp. NPDC049366]|uniref:hypothetical protein n=1 Tax=Micromonospora sp. NPDC049366 TaxID=3364271 RepID=UPI0037A8EB93
MIDTDSVATLPTDDTLAGRVLVCQAREPRRLLPADGWSDHVDRLVSGTGVVQRVSRPG